MSTPVHGMWSRISIAALLLYWSALALGTHLPGDAVPSTPYSDKTLHFTAFAGLAFLLCWAWATRRAFLPRGPVFAVLVATIYAALDETTQTMIPGRFGDIVDWYYDVAGAVAGTAVFSVLERITRRVARTDAVETSPADSV